MDAAAVRAYIPRTMNRFLLSLLALLTGLVAQVSPVQAAVHGAGEAEVGAFQLAHGATRLARKVIASAAKGRIAQGYARSSEAQPLPHLRIASIGVRIGIDRARQ